MMLRCFENDNVLSHLYLNAIHITISKMEYKYKPYAIKVDIWMRK